MASMQELFIKYYQKISDMAFKNLALEKNFQFKKLLNNNSMMLSVEDHYSKILNTKEAKKMIKEYKKAMNNMSKLASKEYKLVLKKLKATKDPVLKQKILNSYANNGITGFVSKNGARWNIETYSNMYTTQLNNELQRMALLEGVRPRQRVKINYSVKPCPLCKPYEGAILTRDQLQEARGNGLFHVRCRHFVYPIER